ncbi:MAG: LuxR C-terminal-related transcriptional regulator [Leptospirillia bacterium]
MQPRDPDPLAILKKRRLPGLVVLDLNLDVMWTNPEGETFMQLGAPDQRVLAGQVIRTGARLVEASLSGEDEPVAADVHLDDDTVYGVRAHFFSGPEGGQAVAVMIEEVALEREIDFDAVRRRYRISRREQDVLRMLYYGKGNREIGELLFISEYTVKDHIKAIMAKMDASSRSEVLYKLTTAA